MLFRLKITHRLLYFAAKPAIHGEHVFKISLAYGKYFIRYPARPRDKIQRIDGLDVLGVHQPHFKHSVHDRDGRDTVMFRRLFGDGPQDLIRNLGVSERAHRYVRRRTLWCGWHSASVWGRKSARLERSSASPSPVSGAAQTDYRGLRAPAR